MGSNILKSSSVYTTDFNILPWSSEDYSNYLSDESKLTAKAASGIAFPRTVEELCSVISELGKAGRRITVSASRTGVTGGALPEEDSVIVSLERLKGLVSAEAGSIAVRSGTTLQELNELIELNCPGCFFPVDPTEQSASVGGAVSLNAGGARSLRFGSMRTWVKSIKVVLANGELLDLERGAHLVDENGSITLTTASGETKRLSGPAIAKPNTKNTIGFSYYPGMDAVDLFVGSEGLLGIIAEVGLKLVRTPELSLSHLQAFSSMENCLKAVRQIREKLAPWSIELIDERSIARVSSNARLTGLLADAKGALFLEAGLESEDNLLEFSETIFEILANLSEDPTRSISGTDRKTLAEIKSFRHAVPESINAIIAKRRETIPGLHKLSTDMAVEDEQLEWVFKLYEQELSGFEFCIFGHAGNNHFHVNILPRTLEELEAAKERYLSLAEQIVSRGGAVAAEHGIGRLKRTFLQKQYNPETLTFFWTIKRFFDPDGLLNPGVLLP